MKTFLVFFCLVWLSASADATRVGLALAKISQAKPEKIPELLKTLSAARYGGYEVDVAESEVLKFLRNPDPAVATAMISALANSSKWGSPAILATLKATLYGTEGVGDKALTVKPICERDKDHLPEIFDSIKDSPIEVLQAFLKLRLLIPALHNNEIFSRVTDLLEHSDEQVQNLAADALLERAGESHTKWADLVARMTDRVPEAVRLRIRAKFLTFQPSTKADREMRLAELAALEPTLEPKSFARLFCVALQRRIESAPLERVPSAAAKKTTCRSAISSNAVPWTSKRRK